MNKIRESYGRYSSFSMALPEDYNYEIGSKMRGRDLIEMQSIETAVFSLKYMENIHRDD